VTVIQLFQCGHSSLTSTPWCITVVPCTDKAVVTLPYESSIQFINTTNNTKDNKIKIGEECYGVTAVKDKIYIGGRNKVNTISRPVLTTTDHSFHYTIRCNYNHDQLISLQGHVYISGADDIHRLSPDGTFRDIVLSKHEGVDDPWSITFNNDFTKLFIINGGKTVLVYSCK
jgi:hypothetical protein